MKLTLLSDLLVFPIVMLGAIIVKSLLLTIGITNSVIFMSCFFLILHLCFTGLMYMQLKDFQDSYVTRIESSAFSAVLTSLAALGTYALIGLLPFLKFPFFFLKYLPYSQIWSDLLIVSLPAFGAHMGGRLVATGLLN
jgi:hypothetical protein